MRLGGVATSVIIPLISAATDSGIISRPAGIDALRAMRSTIGMKIATTPVEDITEPTPATITISRKISFASLAPARAVSQSPSRCATPVRTSASPITKSAAINTMLGSDSPISASDMVITPVIGSATIIITATTSMRGRLSANITTAAPSSINTDASGDIYSLARRIAPVIAPARALMPWGGRRGCRSPGCSSAPVPRCPGTVASPPTVPGCRSPEDRASPARRDPRLRPHRRPR